MRGTAPVLILDVSGTMNPRQRGKFVDMKACAVQLLSESGASTPSCVAPGDLEILLVLRLQTNTTCSPGMYAAMAAGEIATSAGAFDVIAFCNAAWAWSATYSNRLSLLANAQVGHCPFPLALCLLAAFPWQCKDLFALSVQVFYSGRQVGGKVVPGSRLGVCAAGLGTCWGLPCLPCHLLTSVCSGKNQGRGSAHAHRA
jgi:hypothetical protein